MSTQEKFEIKRKIQEGLELTYVRLVAEKRATNGELVILRNNKIVMIRP